MENKFKRIIENLEEGKILTLDDLIFLNEVGFDEYIYIYYFILGKLTFFEIDFKRVDFIGSTFVDCEFKNFRFKNVILRKCNLGSITFLNLKLKDLTKVNFYSGLF